MGDSLVPFPLRKFCVTAKQERQTDRQTWEAIRTGTRQDPIVTRPRRFLVELSRSRKVYISEGREKFNLICYSQSL